VAKTYQDVITEARVLLQDSDSDGYRFSNTVLIAILNRALQALARIRPDACYDLYDDNSLNVPELVEESPGSGQTLWTATFGLEMQFFNPLVHYVVGMAEVTDDEYTEDGRAQLLLGQFKASIVGL
jgi:hypothetical protein